MLPIDRNFGKTPDYIDNVSPYIQEELNKLSQPGRKTTDYVVPYMWGTAGLLYNKADVSRDEVMSWKCLWDPRFRNKILMKDSYRDAYGNRYHIRPCEGIGEWYDHGGAIDER